MSNQHPEHHLSISVPPLKEEQLGDSIPAAVEESENDTAWYPHDEAPSEPRSNVYDLGLKQYFGLSRLDRAARADTVRGLQYPSSEQPPVLSLVGPDGVQTIAKTPTDIPKCKGPSLAEVDLPTIPGIIKTSVGRLSRVLRNSVKDS